MSEELKPIHCPFCRSDLTIVSSRTINGWKFVYCQDCLAEGPAKDDEAEAIAAWNRRAQDVARAPEGWKLVPIEPTVEMIAAMHFKGDVYIAIGHALFFKEAEEDYAAMLVAAPAAPAVALTEEEKVFHDALIYGIGVMKGGKHVPPWAALVSAPAQAEQQGECVCKGPLGHTRDCPKFDESMMLYDPFGIAAEQQGDGGALMIALLEARYALESIRRYGLDTLSGRTDDPDDREWQRAGVNEMTKRARLAIEQIDGTVEQPSARVELSDEQRENFEVRVKELALSHSFDRTVVGGWIFENHELFKFAYAILAAHTAQTGESK